MAAHRFWRFNCLPSGGSGNYVALAALAFRDGTGATIPVVNPLSSGGGDYNPPSDAFAGPNNFWASNNAAPWIGADYGAGNAIDVQFVTMSDRNDQYGSAQAPMSGSVDWSDDGAEWTNLYAIPAQQPWGQGEKRTFPAPGAPPLPTFAEATAMSATIVLAVTPPNADAQTNALAATIVMGLTPPVSDAQVNGLCVTVAAFMPPYRAPPVVVKLPCLSYCLPLYYIKEEANVL